MAQTPTNAGHASNTNNDFAALSRELAELEQAIDVETTRFFDPATSGGRTLREAFVAQAGKVAHAGTRLTVVLRQTRDAATLPPLAAELVEAVAILVSAEQLLTKRGAAGRTLRYDIRSMTRGIVRSVASTITPLDACFAARERGEQPALVSQMIAKRADDMLYHTGVLLKLCDDVPKLPASDTTAVRRRLLRCAHLVRSSMDEISSDHGLDDPAAEGGEEQGITASMQGVSLSGPAPPSAAAGAPWVSLGGATPGGPNSDVDEDDDEEEEDDEEGATLPRATLRAGVRSLSLLLRCLKHALACMNSAIAAVGAAEPDVGPPSPLIVAGLDDLADATGPLSDAVIDFAAALNDGEAEETRTALPLVQAALVRCVTVLLPLQSAAETLQSSASPAQGTATAGAGSPLQGAFAQLVASGEACAGALRGCAALLPR